MVFTSYIFVFYFLPIVLLVYYLLPFRRNLFLLAASYVFYGWWNPWFVFLILFSTTIDFACGLAITESPLGSRRRLAAVSLSIVANLSLLGFFKYFNFFVDSALAFGNRIGFSWAARDFEIVLPVGISFFTFQTMSYTIDIYRGRLKSVSSLRDFALFVAFFPQLVAGPIVRASEFLPQLVDRRRLRDVPFRWCSVLFVLGLIKKTCIADNIAALIDPMFADAGTWTATATWIGAAARWSVRASSIS